MSTIHIFIQKQIKGWLLLFLLISCFEGKAAKEIILNTTGRNSTNVIENTYSRLQILNSVSSFNSLLLNTDKGEFVEILLDSYSKTNTIGAPQLPVLSKLIEIPAGSTPEVKVLSYDLKEYRLADLGITQKIFPAQAPQSKSDNQVKPLEFNQQVYQTNSFIKQIRARVEIAGYLRGVRLANLILSPVEYNPVTNTIRIYDNLVVEILFTGANRIKTLDSKVKTQSPYFKSVFSKVLNYQAADSNPEGQSVVAEKYVIVADPMFQEALQPFVKWKTQRGFKVIEAYTNDPAVGNSLNSIKTYLQNLYTSASSSDPAPTFILFAGDVTQIPAFNCGDHVSDLYYCEYTGDYLPEVFYGRFSANTVAELLPQINKTLQYEQYRMPDPSFLSEVVLVAGADATHQARWGNGMVNYGATYYFNEAHNLSARLYRQPEPAESNYPKNIRSDISKGVSFAAYSAHGNREGWADPLFSIADIPALLNVGKYGLIVGNACQTNAYDQISFGEALLRAENKGALGYIGASGLSYWDEDYWWGVGSGSIVTNPAFESTGPGAYDRIFHDHGEPISEWFSTMGQMVFAGNLAVQESNSEIKKYYWESYCLMGDPSTMVYFGVPAPLPGNYSSLLPLGISTFEIRTEPFANVAISKNNILHGVATTDENGLALVSLHPFTESGYADIVITKQNRQPYIDSVKVASPESPYLVLRNFMINDDGGNNNHLPEYGEPLSLNILLDNLGKAGTRKAVSKLSTNDNYFTITSDTYTWSSIPGNSSASATNAFSLQVSGDVPDNHTAFFTITTQAGSDSYRSEFSFTALAPMLLNGIITIDDSTAGNGNRQIDAGETIFLTMPTTNTGHSTSGEVSTQLFIFDDNESSCTQALDLGKLVPGATGNSTFSFKVSPEAAPGSVLTLFITATAGPYNSVSNLNLPIGAQAEHFESGLMKYNWQFKGNRPWEINSSESHDGLFIAESGVINHSEKSEMYLEGQFLFNDTISFYRKVSSESGYDFLKFFIDEAESGSWSGNKDWEIVSFPVSYGNHRLRWVYEKDEATSAGSDAAWIDNIQFPAFSQAASGSVTAKVIAVPATICAGEQSQLFMFAPGETSVNNYQWSPIATLNNTGIFNPVAAPIETTTYGVNASGKSFSTSGNIIVNVQPLPATPVITVSEDHLVSSAAEGNQWYNSQGPISEATGQIFFPLSTETYYVINRVNGCISNPSNDVMFTFAGIKTVEENGFLVYPNPFKKSVYFDYTIKTAGHVTIVLYNSIGKEINCIEEGEKSAGRYKAFFDGSCLSPGIYTCKFSRGESVYLVKVIKN